MRNLKLIVAGLALFAVALARAQTTEEMVADLSEQMRTADAEMNSVYSQLLEKQDADGKELLKKAQRAWVEFRDAEAASLAGAQRGGREAGIQLLAAKVALIQDRIEDLKMRGTEPEND
jgi:uncharacterized protein YecT (DUF1311 family)